MSDTPIPGATRLEPSPGGPTAATFADIDVRAGLRVRPYRSPDYERENRALAVLAREMAANPRNILQKLVEVAADLCDAHMAGISLLDGEVFRWEAHRSFSELAADANCVEALLIPFHHQGSPIGTIWIVSRSETRKFDSEDERIVSVLVQFASSAWQLWTAYEAAAESSERKSDFLALIGHELRNPLGAITSAAALARQRQLDGETSTQQMNVIIRQCQHMVRLVDDLMDMARAENGKLELRKRLIDIGAVIRETVDTKRQQVEDHHHHLALDLEAGPLLVEADPVRVAQVVANLVDNAAKYTPDGGTVTVAAHRTAGEIEISVSDTGEGLPPEQLTNIFNPFIQLNQSSRNQCGGLGLGLPLVQTLAELHGGRVRADSAGVGQGSCFTVSLPAPAPASAPARADGEAVADRRQSRAAF